MEANSWGVRYVSMSHKQQQHKAVQQAVRDVSPVSFLSCPPPHTLEREREKVVQEERRVDKVIWQRREKSGRPF